MDFSKKGKNPSFLSSRYVVVTEEWTCLFVDKVVLKNTEHPTQEMVADRKQFSFPRFRNIWRVINTDSLYLAKKMLVNLSLNIICSSKLKVFLDFRSLKTSHFGTGNVCGQISAHIFAPNEGLCSYSYLSRVTIISSANKCIFRWYEVDTVR